MNSNPSPVPVKALASNIKVRPPSSNLEAVGSGKPAPAIQASSSTSKSGPEKGNVVEEGDYESILLVLSYGCIYFQLFINQKRAPS